MNESMIKLMICAPSSERMKNMGLIKAGIGALGGTLADQWKEFFYCDALPTEVLSARV